MLAIGPNYFPVATGRHDAKRSGHVLIENQILADWRPPRQPRPILCNLAGEHNFFPAMPVERRDAVPLCARLAIEFAKLASNLARNTVRIILDICFFVARTGAIG